MNRRSFLGGLAALIGGVVLGEAIPFNRVWSFPSNIVIAHSLDAMRMQNYMASAEVEAIALAPKAMLAMPAISNALLAECGGRYDWLKPAI